MQPVQQEVIKQNEVITREQTPAVKSPETIDPDGFQRALKPIRVRVSPMKDTNVINTFQVLNEKNDLEPNGETEEEIGVVKMVHVDLEGGASLNPNG